MEGNLALAVQTKRKKIYSNDIPDSCMTSTQIIKDPSSTLEIIRGSFTYKLEAMLLMNTEL
jgi:hypothetical protein